MSNGVPAGQPRWLTGTKIAMILLSLVIVGLSAFAITIIKTFGERRFAGPGSAALFIFTVSRIRCYNHQTPGASRPVGRGHTYTLLDTTY